MDAVDGGMVEMRMILHENEVLKIQQFNCTSMLLLGDSGFDSRSIGDIHNLCNGWKNGKETVVHSRWVNGRLCSDRQQLQNYYYSTTAMVLLQLPGALVVWWVICWVIFRSSEMHWVAEKG